MIFSESPATLQLMIALLEVGSLGATREHLVKKAGIGTTTFYRVVRPLMERGIIVQQGHSYFLPLSEWYNYRFKLWHDAERLYQLSHKDRHDVLDILQHARQSLGQSLSCLFLVGSAAHNTLMSTSDFDFLAVVSESTLYHPTATRDVNFVTITEREFQERYAGRDGFILSALQYGLLLFDRDFSQTYYATTTSVHPLDSKRHETEESMEHQRKRFFSAIENDDLERAAALLQAVAVSLTRLILQTLGELPAGKPDLLALSETFLGHRFRDWLHEVLSGKLDRDKLVARMRRWSEYRERFFQNTAHLKTFARMPYGRAELEEQAGAIFQELLPDAILSTKNRVMTREIDLVIKSSTATYVVEFKSMERQIERSALEQVLSKAVTYAGQFDAKGVQAVLIANSFRSLPVMERSETFSASLREQADQVGVHLLSAVDLMRAHNVLHLEDVSKQQILRQILPTRERPSGGRKSQKRIAAG